MENGIFRFALCIPTVFAFIFTLVGPSESFGAQVVISAEAPLKKGSLSLPFSTSAARSIGHSSRQSPITLDSTENGVEEIITKILKDNPATIFVLRNLEKSSPIVRVKLWNLVLRGYGYARRSSFQVHVEEIDTSKALFILPISSTGTSGDFLRGFDTPEVIPPDKTPIIYGRFITELFDVSTTDIMTKLNRQAFRKNDIVFVNAKFSDDSALEDAFLHRKNKAQLIIDLKSRLLTPTKNQTSLGCPIFLNIRIQNLKTVKI